jgi:creatinine amidohydrolase
MAAITESEARELYSTNPVVLLPMGSQEDQGPHAPMGDYLFAAEIAELAALHATASGCRTVVTPVIPFGGGDHFDSMVGGIALSKATLTIVLSEVIGSLHRHGLTRIIILNGHGGNTDPILAVGREIYRRTKLIIPSLYLWRICLELLPGIVGPERAGRSAGHGADPLTSVGLSLFPNLMRPDLIAPSQPLKRNAELDLPYVATGTVSFERAEIGVATDYSDAYSEGVGKGDPTLSNKETGTALVEQLTSLVSRFIQHYVTQTDRPL